MEINATKCEIVCFVYSSWEETLQKENNVKTRQKTNIWERGPMYDVTEELDSRLCHKSFLKARFQRMTKGKGNFEWNLKFSKCSYAIKKASCWICPS